MENPDYSELIEKLYVDDEYIIKNPSLHEEDAPWKVTKILPLVDRYMMNIDKDEINILDVGGGAGLILRAVSDYIVARYGVRVSKFMLDLSPGMLETQIKRNPEYRKALNEDIRETSLANKEIDLALIIDLIEHVGDPGAALREIGRISGHAIFKVPLEDTLLFKAINLAKKGEPRQSLIENWGHINAYNFRTLRRDIERFAGKIRYYSFTDACEYYSHSDIHRKKLSKKGRLMNQAGAVVFRISPRICASTFNDFAMILVECY